MKWSNCHRMRVVFVVFVTVIVFGGGRVKADFTFGEAVNLGPTVNTSYGEAGQSISTDGLILYFGDYPANPDPRGYGGCDIWKTTRNTINDVWSSRTNLGPTINTSSDEATPCISADGLTLYFASNRAGGHGNWDLWMTTRETTSDPWGEPENLGPTVNSPDDEICPSISADGLELYFSEYMAVRAGGYGGCDLWVTKRPTQDDPWGTPVNLGDTVNSSTLDMGPCISADKLTLFFGSWRPGGGGPGGIWMTRRAIDSDPWGTPASLGPTVNGPADEGVPSLSADGSTLYFCSNRSGGNGGWDLWQASVIPIVDFSGDGQVDGKDASILADHWHSHDPLCDIGPTPLGDGIVDVQDLIVLSEYLEPGFGRIAHWKLDEASGDIAYDSIGQNHADILGDAAWQPDAGIVGGALEFDGVDDYIAPTLILNPMDRAFRILAWVKGGEPGQIIASQTPDEFTPGWTYLKADPSDGALVTESILPNMPLDSDVVITNDEWYEVGLEWDGEHRHLLINGDQVAVDEVTLPALPCTGWLNVGTGPNTESGTFWSGLIDDVRVYEKGRQ